MHLSHKVAYGGSNKYPCGACPDFHEDDHMNTAEDTEVNYYKLLPIKWDLKFLGTMLLPVAFMVLLFASTCR